MNADFRLSTAFFENLKTIKLQRKLGSDGIVALLRLWAYAAKHKPTGDFGCCDETDIEIIAGWTGEPGNLVSCLADLRFLEKTESGFRIHEWALHNPFVVHGPERTEKAKKAAAARWARKNQPSADGMLEACNEQCSEHANRNAPSPSPNPIPIPKKIYTSDSVEIGLSNLLLGKILFRNPGFKKPNLQTWAKPMDLMVRIDGRDPEDVRHVITWCQNDPFWQNNILSAATLRKKYDQLFMLMKGNGNGSNQSGRPSIAGGSGTAGQKATGAVSDGSPWPKPIEYGSA